MPGQLQRWCTVLKEVVGKSEGRALQSSPEDTYPLKYACSLHAPAQVCPDLLAGQAWLQNVLLQR
eukprot:1160527-Pelagomonas_calceolata.AAC.6